MRELFKVGLASAAFVVAAFTANTAPAGDFGLTPPPAETTPSHCYFRSDLGYSFSESPEAFYGQPPNDEVSAETLGDGWFAEAGVGCGAGDYGFRGEFVLGYRSKIDFHGEPPNPPVPNDPVHTSLVTYTAMFNVFYDLGNFSGFVPYVGAGLGVAYHKMDDVIVTGNPFSPNPQAGDEDLSFAWMVTAGFAYQLTARTSLDFAYRYIDLGSASSERADTAFAVNPFLDLEDLTAHEIKAGFRYKFGQLGCCSGGMK